MKAQVHQAVSNLPTVELICADFANERLTTELPAGFLPSTARYVIATAAELVAAIDAVLQAASPTSYSLSALHTRALRLRDLPAEDGAVSPNQLFWKGYAKGLEDLANGIGAKAARQDSLIAEGICEAKATEAGLPIGIEDFSAIEVPQLDRSQIAERSLDDISQLQIDRVQDLEHGVLARPIESHDERLPRSGDFDDCAFSHAEQSKGSFGGQS